MTKKDILTALATNRCGHAAMAAALDGAYGPEVEKTARGVFGRYNPKAQAKVSALRKRGAAKAPAKRSAPKAAAGTRKVSKGTEAARTAAANAPDGLRVKAAIAANRIAKESPRKSAASIAAAAVAEVTA